MQRSQYAAKKISEIPGVSVKFPTPFFKEFIVDFQNTGISVADVNNSLLKENILGGCDLSRDFPELSQSSLYCVTELHTKGDIDTLINAIRKIVG